RRVIATLGLPASVDAERFVLGSILVNGGLFLSVATTLVADDFSIERHRRIFQRMGDLHNRGEHIDRLTVYTELEVHGEAKTCGGVRFLAALYEGMPILSNVDSYIRIVQEKSALRRIILVAEDLSSRAMFLGEMSGEIVAVALEAFSSISVRGLNQHYRS